MSAISYSAPIYTKKQEQEESISQEAKDSALNDIFGRNLNNSDGNVGELAEAFAHHNVIADVEDADISDELMDDFEMSLDNLLITLEEQEKESYLLALEKAAPGVVSEESNPKFFLRCHDYDAVNAAKQLISYWKLRLEMFGAIGLQPMTLSGAMKDIVQDMILMPNYLRWLPPDNYGRSILCADRTHVMHNDYDQSIFPKLVFYAFHVGISRNVSIQKNGMIILLINRFTSAYGYDDLKRKYVGSIVNKIMCGGFPIKTKSVHICSTSMALTIQVPIVKFFMSPEMRQRLIVHSSRRNEALLESLETFGMKRHNLPMSIGGEYDSVSSWISECKIIMKIRRKRQKRDRRSYEERQRYFLQQEF